jgi:GTP 3',8-cyclase
MSELATDLARCSNTVSPQVLRLSATDRCNFRCRYCMAPEGAPKVAQASLLSLEQLSAVAAWLCRYFEIHRVKLTGGEPLVRKGVEKVIQSLLSVPGITEISLTTNGSLLRHLAVPLKQAGLSRVNVSLDTLDSARFQTVTRGGNLDNTLAGITAAVAAGLVPVKLNSVLQKSTWIQDVPSLLDYAALNGFELRFIELMHTGTESSWCQSEFVPGCQVYQWLSQRTVVTTLPCTDSAPARLTRIWWRGVDLLVGWILPRSFPFCARCDRLRLDARGRLYRCLMDPAYLDLATLLREKGEDAALLDLNCYVLQKSPPTLMDKPTAMSLIGG